jgi:hypothetical protein
MGGRITRTTTLILGSFGAVYINYESFINNAYLPANIVFSNVGVADRIFLVVRNKHESSVVGKGLLINVKFSLGPIGALTDSKFLAFPMDVIPNSENQRIFSVPTPIGYNYVGVQILNQTGVDTKVFALLVSDVVDAVVPDIGA